MLTMVHTNPARVDHGVLRVDRKFHLGMKSYVEQIVEPIVSIHPASAPNEQTMDAIEVPCRSLGYQIVTVRTDGHGRPVPDDLAKIEQQIRGSRLVYGGGFGTTAIARQMGVPYILVLEYDLQTQITVTTSQVSSRARKSVRAMRRVAGYVSTDIADMVRAHGLHCNGYPVFDQSGRFNGNRLLYLDSRMSRSMVISEDDLAHRLAGRFGRPLRLLYSGRYEPIKGAADAVRVGLECLRRGLDVEMHCYGQGSLAPQMARLAAESGSRIHVHDAVPYPELVKISQGFDIFVCCHVQSDPSCTYLESFGAGLPIVGYANRMWRRLSAESGAGFASPMARPAAVVDNIQRLAADFSMLSRMSAGARRFAADHAFEEEFARRVGDLNAVLARSGPADGQPVTQPRGSA